MPTSDFSFNYVFNYTDHLGNVRLSYTKDPQTGTLEILDENHYYPFGLKHGVYTAATLKDFRIDEMGTNGGIGGGVGGVALINVTKTEYQYKYNGKELQDELGLDWYDYGAKNYDATIGRWMNMDPLAEEDRRWTPYRYAYNNPLIFIDPDGMLEHIYELNEETGDINLIERNNDDHDTLVAKNGDVIADNIHKGIFNEAESVNIQEDGLTVNNLTGESVKSLSSFVLRLSIYTQTEIAYGIYGFADQNGKLVGDTRFADVMPYSGNTDRTSTAAPTMDGTILTAQVHTHPSFEGGSTNMSGGDRLNLQVNKPMQSTILGRFGTATYKVDSKTGNIEKASGKTFKSPYTKENIKNNLGWKKQF
ncbi:MAG: RHS repeat-associated core domain-containing protein [Weeksellaceae bacterium]